MVVDPRHRGDRRDPLRLRLVRRRPRVRADGGAVRAHHRRAGRRPVLARLPRADGGRGGDGAPRQRARDPRARQRGRQPPHHRLPAPARRAAPPAGRRARGRHPTGAHRLAADRRGLDATAHAVRSELVEADESRKGNPRALLHRRDARTDHERLAALDQIVFHVRDISSVLADTIWERPGAFGLDPDLTPPLRDACRAVADVLDLEDPESPERHRALAEAARAVRLLVETVDREAVALGKAMGPGVLTAMHLRRVLGHLRPAEEDDATV
ncbi:hypothetical protein [Clavibacter tessellarius]|uniref:hypothetical protein n=1 Tax=Clavibacter tessellarius TaxID=31965 RepID=UPI0032521AC0